MYVVEVVEMLCGLRTEDDQLAAGACVHVVLSALSQDLDDLQILLRV